jgi:hypothetical protein
VSLSEPRTQQGLFLQNIDAVVTGSCALSRTGSAYSLPGAVAASVTLLPPTRQLSQLHAMVVAG